MGQQKSLYVETVMSNWQLIYSKPRQEDKARQHLLNQAVEVYFPQISVEKVIKGKLCCIMEPLFPRYLFVKIPENVAWTSVRSSRGVCDFVRFGNEVAEINEQLLQQINSVIDTQISTGISNIPCDGDEIIIKSGEFSGLSGIFKSRDGEQRCFVLLEMLGRTNKVKMDLVQVSKAS